MMAAPVISLAFLSYFKPLFIFIFVFVLFYAVLTKTEMLGTNKGIHFMFAFSVAILFLFTSRTLEFVELVAPWLVVLIIIFMSFMMLFLFLGVQPEIITKTISEPGIAWTIVITLIVILVIAMIKVFGADVRAVTYDSAGNQVDKFGNIVVEEDNFMKEVGEIVFSTKVLGMFLLLLIASMAIRALA